MTYTTMPFGDIQDSAKFGVSQENNVLGNDSDGGYLMTRPRNTRRPRKTWSSGFTALTQAQFEALQAFFDTVGGAVIFNWFNPSNGITYAVRFSKDTTMQFSYSGAGDTRRYDGSFKVVEA